MLDDITKSAERDIGIKAYPRSILRIIGAIKSSDDFWEIVDISDEPLPLVAYVIEKLVDKGFIEVKNGKIVLRKDLEGEVSQWHKCFECDGRGVIIDDFKKEFETFMEIQRERPSAKKEFDQGYVTPLTTFSRIAYADQKGDIRGKEVIILGDDDLVSLALALTHLASRVVLLDIDKRIVDFVSKSARSHGVDVEAHVFDLRNPLDERFLHQFDTFFTDPPETVAAFKAFIGRGLATLKGARNAGYFGITRRESSLNKWRELEKVLISDFGVVITDILHNFNVYVNWEYWDTTRAYDLSPSKTHPKTNWYKSALFRIETLEDLRIFNDPIEGDIYNDVESSTT